MYVVPYTANPDLDIPYFLGNSSAKTQYFVEKEQNSYGSEDFHYFSATFPHNLGNLMFSHFAENFKYCHIKKIVRLM